MLPAHQRRTLQDPQQILEALESFLKAATSPILIEDGRPAMPISPDRLRLELSDDSVILESWGPEGATVRRLTALLSQSRTKIEVRAKRFAQADVRLSIIDSAATSMAGSSMGHSSEAFLERLIAREFPYARVSRLSGATDLQHSLSGRHVRCRMDEKKLSWAVTAAPPLSSPDACDCAITTGLLWLESLRQTDRKSAVAGLRLFLPRGREERTCRVLQALNERLAAYELYVYDSSGATQKVQLSDAGNRNASFNLRFRPPAFGPPLVDWIERLQQDPRVETVAQANGSLSLRVLGMEFASTRGHEMHFGLETSTPVTPQNFRDVLQLADRLASFRNPGAPDRDHPLYRALPERWLESQIRLHLTRLDRTLGEAPLYGQSETVDGLDRGIIDLITVDRSARLVILEVKATANLQLPIQSLDYWARVDRIHRTSPDLLSGLFPSQPISSSSPRLILVAPALEFHPTTELLTRYFRTDVPVERIGLNTDWRGSIKKQYQQLNRDRPDSFATEIATT